jgi:hypothetical protein
MNQMNKAVFASIETTKEKVLAYNLSDQETSHIDLCIAIIKKAAVELTEEIAQLSDMKDLF